MSLNKRIWLLIITALMAMLAISAIAIWSISEAQLKDRQDKLLLLVKLARSASNELYEKQQRGEITQQEAQEQAKKIIGGFKEKDEYFFVRDYTSDVTFVHPNPKRIGVAPSEDMVKKGNHYREAINHAKPQHEGIGFYIAQDGTRPGVEGKVEKIYAVTKFAPWNWIIGFGDYYDDIRAQFWENVTLLMIVVSVLLLAIGGLALRLSRNIRHQLGGEPAYASQIAHEIAAGNLASPIRVEGPDGCLLDSMQGMQAGLQKMVQQIRQISGQLTESSGLLSQQMQAVSNRAVQTAEATSSTAAAIEEMTVSIDHISQSARETEENSRNGTALATTGEELVLDAAREIRHIADEVANAVGLIRSLVERSREIDSMSAVIKDIADQTNLLALNAAIEAARAGDTGRGFAVVADEVRKLAERTAGATQDITRTIQAIQHDTADVAGRMDEVRGQVNHGVNLAEQAASALRKINDGAQLSLQKSQDVADAAREQSAASNSIAANVERIARMVEESNSAVQSVDTQVNHLNRLAQNLETQAGRFRL